MSNKKKVPFALLTKTGFAAAIVGSSVAAPFLTANAAENDEGNKAESKAGNDTQKGIDVDVNNSAVEKAVEEAKAAGINVKQNETKHSTATPDNVEKVKSEIVADNEKQAKELEAKTKEVQKETADYTKKKSDYDQRKKAYDTAMTKYKADMDTYNKQLEEFKKAKSEFDSKKAQYQKDKADYDKAKAQYDKDLADYQAKVKQNASDKDQYQKDLDAYKKAKAEYDKKVSANNDAKAQYEKDLADYNAKVEQIKKENQALKDAYTKKVDAEKSIVDKAKSNPKQPSYSEGEGGAYTKSGNWTNLAAKTLNGGDIHVASKGDVNSLADLQNGNFAIHAYSDSNKLKNSNIIQKITWGDVQPKGASSLTKGDMITEDAKEKLKSIGYNDDIYNTSGEANQFAKTTQLWSVKAGEWVTIPKAIHLADGSTKDLKVKFAKSGTKLDYGEDWVTFWNEGNSINYYDGSMDRTHTPPKETISATYKVDDGGANEDYLWTGVTLDIDSGQQLTMNGDNYAILGMGGGLKADGDTIKSIKADDGLGINWGKNKTEDNFLDGTSSIPDGTIVYARYGNQISHSLANTGVKNATLVANGDFGLGVKTSVAEYPKLKKLPEKPTPPDESTPKKPTPPEAPGNVGNPPEEPKAPTPPGEAPKEPVKPTPPKDIGNPPEEPQKVNVEYHLNKLTVDPTNHKDVENGITKVDTDKSIHEKEVQVGDTVTYPLTNSALPADRTDEITSYQVYDEVPDGFEPNEEEIKKNIDGKLWNVKVDGQKVTFTATKDLLSDMNKDLKKVFEVTDLPIVGTITKASDKPLENDFTTTIGTKSTLKDGDNGEDGGNKITVKSNKVVNTTPKPVESKVHKYIVENGKLVEKNESKKGEKLTYQGDVQFSNTTNAKSRTISDQLDKERLDLDDVKIYLAKDDSINKDEDNSNLSNENNDNKETDSNDDMKSNDIESNQPTSDKDPEVNDNNKSQPDETTKEEPSDKDNETEVVNKQQADEIDKDDKSDDKDKASDVDDDTSSNKDDTSDDKDDEVDSKSDITNSDDSNKESETNDSDSDDSTTPFDVKNGQDVTDQGDLKLDKDNESFTWTAKDPKKFAGKKVTVVIGSTIKKDAKGQIDNVIQLKEDDKTTDSNKVTTTLKEDPKPQEEAPIPPKKEDPKDPEQPQPEQPEQPKQPEQKQEQHQTVTQPKQSQQQTQKASTPAVQKINPALPSTGSDVKDFGIIGAVLAVLGGAGAYVLKRRKDVQNTNE